MVSILFPWGPISFQPYNRFDLFLWFQIYLLWVIVKQCLPNWHPIENAVGHKGLPCQQTIFQLVHEFFFSNQAVHLNALLKFILEIVVLDV